MTRVPVHMGIGNHSAPAAILPRSPSQRLGPSDPTCHNVGTTTALQGLGSAKASPQAVPTGHRETSGHDIGESCAVRSEMNPAHTERQGRRPRP